MLGRQLGQQVVERVRGVAGLVPEHRADDVAVGEIVDAAVADARAFHVAEERHRIVRARLAGDEHAAACVPARMEIRVAVLDEGEFGAGGEAGVEQIEPDLAVARRAFVIAEEIGLAGTFDAERADVAPLRHAPGSALADVDRAAFGGGVFDRQREAERFERGGVGAADAVLAAADRVDEVAILAARPDRCRCRGPGGRGRCRSSRRGRSVRSRALRRTGAGRRGGSS